MTDKAKGNVALLLAAILWGTGFIGQKLGNEILPPIAFNSIRQVAAGIALLPVLAADLKRSGYMDISRSSAGEVACRKKRMIPAAIICGIFLLLGTNLQQIGLLTVSAGKSGFITSIYIVFTPLLSVLIGEKVRLRTFFCIALAMAGFAVMSLQEGFDNVTAGDWLSLASALAFSAQIVAVNHFVDEGNAIAISVSQMLVGGTGGLLISLFAEHPALSDVAACIPVLLYTIFIPTAAGYTLQIVGQKYTDASIAALIMSLEAVFAAVFGMVFLGEMMSLREIAGAVIILTATVLGQIEPKKNIL